MDQAGLKQQWLVWAEKNIGGSEARAEIATQAAISALGQGKSRDEAVAAARSAAADWKTPSEPTLPDSRVADLHLPSGEPERVQVNPSPAPLIEKHKEFIRGRVSAMQQRQEIEGYHQMGRTKVPTYGIVWSFRLQPTGPDGNPPPPVAIEMRAPSFLGSIGNGDEVEVEARDYAPGSILFPTEIRNLTTNSIVRAAPKASTWLRIRWLVLVIFLFITGIGSFLLFVYHLLLNKGK